MKIIYKVDYKLVRRDCRLRYQLFMVLLGLVTIVEGFILFFSLGYFSSDLRAMILFSEELDTWTEKDHETRYNESRHR